MIDRLYLLKIKLIDIQPEIWRRFIVPDFISLDRLHDIVQIVMGWQDCHLYEINISETRYTEDPENDGDGLEAGKYRLVDLVKKKGSTFSYIYDFGDWWDHEITVEDSNYSLDALYEKYDVAFGSSSIECLDGARACPPEDVGSVFGYVDFCEAIKNPKHENHKSMKKWYKDHFYDAKIYDSEQFNLEKVNQYLRKYIRWSRERYL